RSSDVAEVIEALVAVECRGAWKVQRVVQEVIDGERMLAIGPAPVGRVGPVRQAVRRIQRGGPRPGEHYGNQSVLELFQRGAPRRLFLARLRCGAARTRTKNL